ncbi:hypothetical protein [Rhodococcus triatomae]
MTVDDPIADQNSDRQQEGMIWRDTLAACTVAAAAWALYYLCLWLSL